ncbi:MAG TPA: NEW3 domain-containing protein, partial [Herpetosiphonaceae bacterium]|nr:NEW3 domain-containing protein [Herpetosiphonaceae bacterium]
MKSRLIMLGLVLALLLPLTALARPTGPVRTQPLAPNTPGVSISPSLVTITGVQGSTIVTTLTVRNDGVAADGDYNYAVTLNAVGGWTATPNTDVNPNPIVNVPPGNTRDFNVRVNIPATTAPGTYTILVNITGTPSDGTGANVTGQAQINVIVVAPTATTTPATPTTTPTNTIPAGTVTATPNNVCNGAAGTRNDGFEPDNSKEQARRIEVDITVQASIQHVMCPEGDEDWMLFGALEGKVYTIDVPTSVDGLDLSLTLYDSNGNQLAFNDDYYLRNNDPTDIKPRIQSWRAPANGTYYIKVRESAGRGFYNGFYTIVVLTESYGPTPTLIPELCIDLFEPDGLPPLAPLMVVGEVHKIKRLCPTGDADWIKFFGAAGKSYSIFTTNATPNVGLDTVMVLTDRDGTSILDFNDDFGTSLDSRIDFSPSVDGFYYVQVKNVGDIGNQFASYSLTFQVSSNANGG